MTIFFISGLGADKRAFKQLCVSEKHNIVYVDWILPYKNETINSYAKRISILIDTTKPFILIGYSFGGMLALEMLDFIKPQKTILLSSVSRRKELPFYYRLVGKLCLNKLIPEKLVTRPNFIIHWFFGIEGETDKTLLNEILISTDAQFSVWAINELVNWNRMTSNSNIIRIHGQKDRLLPIINFKPNYLLSNAGHFMAVNRAKEVSVILNSEIDDVIL